MKISEFTINHLAKVVCGDSPNTPYLKGYELVIFFNKYGFNDTYEQGFPSRWKFTEDKLRALNNTDSIIKIIEEIVDPRRFHGQPMEVEPAVQEINDLLKYDKFELKKHGEFYKITDIKGVLIQPETANEINHEFVNEQIVKCQRKISDGDFKGAITNARSLIEAIFIEIIERHEEREFKNDGTVENQWTYVKKIMKLEIDKATLPDYVIQILSGLDTAIKGLAGLSNNAGDRHATKFSTKRHHAKLAVNLALTISDFLVDSWNYQAEKKKPSTQT